MYWAIKKFNFDMKQASDKRKLQLNELEELRHGAYENAKLYKKRTKAYHDKQLVRKEFHVGQKVLIYNSLLRLFSGKLKSRWSGPCVVTKVLPHGTLEVHSSESNRTFTVIGHRVKPYFKIKWIPRDEDLALQSIQYAATPRALEPHLVDFKCTLSKELHRSYCGERLSSLEAQVPLLWPVVLRPLCAVNFYYFHVLWFFFFFKLFLG